MKNKVEEAVLAWLLEPTDIGVRYLALRDLSDKENIGFLDARKRAHVEGPIAQVLARMGEEGFWGIPGAGYYPKYTGTIWSIILLAQLGASMEEDKNIVKACSYLLEHALTRGGQFTVNGLPSGTADCLQGNLCAALLDLGCDDPRLDTAVEWMAKSVTGDGVARMEDKAAPVRYYAGKCGPNFTCGSNNKLPCAWGAVKVMFAFSKLPHGKRTPLVNEAIKIGVDFLFSRDPAAADYPSGYSPKPSSSWWKLGFPVFYVTDVLQIAEVLLGLGYASDPRLARLTKLIRDKRDGDGRWSLEYNYTGKTWVDFGPKKLPNKWVTLRALRMLQAVA